MRRFPRPSSPRRVGRVRAAGLAAAALGLVAVVAAAPGAAASAAAGAGAGSSGPPTPDQCLALTGGRCLTPAGLRTAYDLDGLIDGGTTGAGVTIGIVDSFGSPTITHDLGVYDAQYGLPPVDLQVVTPAGAPPAFDPHDQDMAGWAGETTLDVEVAHTVAPGAKILLIETPTSETEGLAGFPDIIKAEQYVVTHHLVDVLSQSFAATEATFDSAAQVRQLSSEIYPAAKAAGVTVLSASGDSGPTDVQLDQKTLYQRPEVDWPASDPLVTAVGGTMLDVAADGSRLAPDAAWGGQPGGGAGGGGRSTIFGRPAFQDGVAATVGAHRGVPDVALDAAPSSGLITYGSYSGGAWSVGGGTSQAAPLLAGIVALADQQAHARVGYLDDVLYELAGKAGSGLVDVTHGSNDLNDPKNSVPGYPATAGYDLATGLGTVDGGRFVPALVAAVAGHTSPLAASGDAAPSTAPTSSAAPAGPASPAPQPAARAATRSSRTSEVVTAVVAAVLLVVVAGGLLLRVAISRRRRGGKAVR